MGPFRLESTVHSCLGAGALPPLAAAAPRRKDGQEELRRDGGPGGPSPASRPGLPRAHHRPAEEDAEERLPDIRHQPGGRGRAGHPQDGYIDFEEFMVVFCVLSGGEPKDVLGKIFRMFDVNGDGEMVE